MSAYFWPPVKPADISMCWHICQHLDVLAYISASRYFNTFASTGTNVLTYVGIFLNTSRMCQHLNALAYVSVSEYADICNNTFFIVLTNMQTYPDADIYVDILRCQHECWHIEMPAYYSRDAEIYVNTVCRVLANMPTYWDADIYMIYVNTLRCRHILLVVRNMPTYMPTLLSSCWQIWQHIQMPTYMLTH